MGDLSVTNATNMLVIEVQRVGSAIDYRGRNRRSWSAT
jgi:hypothetical protein